MDLLKALYSIDSRGVKSPETEDKLASAVPKRINYSVRSKSRQILELLKAGDFRLNELYRNCSSRSELVATFMSILELCSVGSINISRNEDDYNISFTGGDIDEILEMIVE